MKMQVKSSRNREDKIRNQFTNVQIGFLKQGTSLYKFCEVNGIDKSYAFRALKCQRTGEKAQALRQRLIEASKSKVATTQSEVNMK